MMSSRLRRGLATFALAAAVSLLAAGPAQAARRESDPGAARVVAVRSVLQEAWDRLACMWGAVTGSWGPDGNR